MIVHIVLMNWNKTLDGKEIENIDSAFARLPALIPEIKSYRFGADLGLFDGNADYALIAEFDNAEDMRVYSTHPDHIDLLKAATGPLLDSYQALQFEQ